MLPVTALVVGLLAVLALLSPGVRHQIELSASHRAQEYVALSFARSPDGTVPACTRAGGEVSVRFVVDSRLRAARTLRYVVTVDDTRRKGTVSVEPGDSVVVTQVVSRPARRFGIAVRLPEVDREISAHCGGATR